MVKILSLICVITVISTINARASMFVPQIPEECQEQTYCEIVPNYPTEYVRQLLNNMSMIHPAPHVPQGYSQNQFYMETLHNEVMWTPTVELEHTIELCPSNVLLLYPKAAKHDNNTWFFLINEGETRQGYRVEMCKNTGGACNRLAVISEGYTGFCKQKYVYKTSEALDRSGQLVKAELIIPSSCTCTLRDS